MTPIGIGRHIAKLRELGNFMPIQKSRAIVIRKNLLIDSSFFILCVIPCSRLKELPFYFLISLLYTFKWGLRVKVVIEPKNVKDCIIWLDTFLFLVIFNFHFSSICIWTPCMAESSKGFLINAIFETHRTRLSYLNLRDAMKLINIILLLTILTYPN